MPDSPIFVKNASIIEYWSGKFMLFWLGLVVLCVCCYATSTGAERLLRSATVECSGHGTVQQVQNVGRKSTLYRISCTPGGDMPDPQFFYLGSGKPDEFAVGDVFDYIVLGGGGVLPKKSLTGSLGILGLCFAFGLGGACLMWIGGAGMARAPRKARENPREVADALSAGATVVDDDEGGRCVAVEPLTPRHRRIMRWCYAVSLGLVLAGLSFVCNHEAGFMPDSQLVEGHVVGSAYVKEGNTLQLVTEVAYKGKDGQMSRFTDRAAVTPEVNYTTGQEVTVLLRDGKAVIAPGAGDLVAAVLHTLVLFCALVFLCRGLMVSSREEREGR